MILLDTSGVLAALFSDQRHHGACAEVLRTAEPPLVLSPFVLAELDYLIAKLAGVRAELELLDEVARGAYSIEAFDSEDLRETRDVIAGWGDLEIGLTDASLVVLSRRLATTGILTLDERHFRTLRGYRDRPFRLLPADG